MVASMCPSRNYESFIQLHKASSETYSAILMANSAAAVGHHRTATHGTWVLTGKTNYYNFVLCSEMVTRFTEKLSPYFVQWSWLYPTSLCCVISKHGAVYDNFYMCILFRYVMRLVNLQICKLMQRMKT
jgi:hypothetical protein